LKEPAVPLGRKGKESVRAQIESRVAEAKGQAQKDSRERGVEAAKGTEEMNGGKQGASKKENAL
jgi:hypothetical protein